MGAFCVFTSTVSDLQHLSIKQQAGVLRIKFTCWHRNENAQNAGI